MRNSRHTAEQTETNEEGIRGEHCCSTSHILQIEINGEGIKGEQLL
jgi:hypothetical protein